MTKIWLVEFFKIFYLRLERMISEISLTWITLTFIVEFLFFNFRGNVTRTNSGWKFCVFKNEKGSFVRFGSRKKIQDSPTKELTSQILLDLSNASMLAKKSLIKTLRKKDYKLEEIVLELRWLVKEGYLNEYSNGMLETN